MNGFKKYCAKLLVIYILLTNTFPQVAFASTLSQPTPQPSAQDQQEQQAAPAPIIQADPVDALPQRSSKFVASSAILGLSTDDATQPSAHTRLGVSVQKLFKHDFKADEDVTLTLDNPDQEKYKTKILDATGKEAPVQLQQNVQNGITDLQVIPTNQFQPGKYTISVTDETGKTTTQDFTWGVLALNPDKAVYQPNETSDLSMAVLDDKGAMVCGAQVELEISNQQLGIDDTLSTDNKKITVNPECSSHAFSLKPDYEAHYQLGGIGTYDLILTAKTANGSRTISETIAVKQATPFAIQRVSATRIYPPNEYPMQINVTANRDFNGTITETVPDSFAITPATNDTSYNSMKTVYLNNNDPGQTVAKSVLGTSASGLVMPFDGTYPITQGFGAQLTDPALQAFYTHYGLGGHDGIDFGLPMGTPLYAVDDGKVTWSGPGDYGTMVTIKHSWGQTYYGHMSKTSVNVGDDIHKGSLIGYSGMSGEATGPHLHFGMKPANPDMSNGYAGKIDPMPYLPIGNSASVGDLIKMTGLPDVLGASTSAESSGSGTAVTPTVTPNLSPTDTPASASATHSSAVGNSNFTIGDAVSQQSAEDQPQTMAKTKVIKWQVNLKKGDKMTLAYDFKTPQISPQFYLIGSLKFYANSNASQLAFDEGRQWQIAADDIGTGWYHPNSGNTGYEWQYRKKLTLDHTKNGFGTISFVAGQSSNVNTTTNTTTINLPGNAASGDLLVLNIGISSGTQPTMSVSDGVNTWTQIGTVNGTAGDGDWEFMYYAQNVTAGNPTITMTGGNISGGTEFSAQLAEYTGADPTNAFDKTNVTVETANTTTPTSGPTTTTSISNELLVGGLADGSTAANANISAGTSYTLRAVQQNGSGREASGLEDRTVTATGTYSANFTVNIPTHATITRVATFRAAHATETNFPVLVSMTDAGLQSHAQSNGNDILFTDANGENKISSEVESYTNTTGALLAWVNVPSLSGSADTNIYMYYGNGSAASQSSTSTWDSHFRMVQHLGSQFFGAAQACNTYNDSTSNTFNMTCSTPNPTVATGEIDGALTVNGTNELLTGSASVDDTMTTGVTVSGWFNTNSIAAANATILRNDGGITGAVNSKGFFLQRGATNKLAGGVWANAGSRVITGATTISISTWYYGVLTYDGTNVTVYLNGIQDGTTATTGSITTSATVLTAGSSAGGAFFNGSLDELRVSDTTRSADWILTEYNNQSNPGTFINGTGSQETKIYSASPAQYMRHGQFFDTSSNNYGRQPFMF